MSKPIVTDFTEVIPPENDLDGFHAWKEFGGLDLTEAYVKFCSNPGCYQEDFMFMGARAFLFYFPVIDRYIQEVEGPVNGFDDEAWILGCAIRAQFEHNATTLAQIGDCAERLCDFVLHGLSQLPEGGTFQPVRKIVDAWVEAKAAVMKAADIPTKRLSEPPPTGSDGGRSP